MGKDTLQKMIDLYVDKELEKHTTKMVQDLFDLLRMFDNCITYDKKLDAYVVSFEDYNRIKSALSIHKQQLKEEYKVGPEED